MLEYGTPPYNTPATVQGDNCSGGGGGKLFDGQFLSYVLIHRDAASICIPRSIRFAVMDANPSFQCPTKATLPRVSSLSQLLRSI